MALTVYGELQVQGKEFMLRVKLSSLFSGSFTERSSMPRLFLLAILYTLSNIYSLHILNSHWICDIAIAKGAYLNLNKQNNTDTYPVMLNKIKLRFNPGFSLRCNPSNK